MIVQAAACYQAQLMLSRRRNTPNGEVVERRTLQYRSGSDNTRAKKCTVFKCLPWDFKENRILGVTLWIPRDIKELIDSAKRNLRVPDKTYCILTEGGARVFDVDLIDNNQNLFLIEQTHDE